MLLKIKKKKMNVTEEESDCGGYFTYRQATTASSQNVSCRRNTGTLVVPEGDLLKIRFGGHDA
jgi:hypothetical protein